MGRRSDRNGWRVLEVAHVPGTTISTCCVAAHRQALDVGASVRGGEFTFTVREVLHECFQFDRLGPETEGQVVLSGPDAASLKMHDMLTLAIPCPVCGAAELTALPYENWTPGTVSVPPPYEDHFGRPSYEVCPNCGFEFGNDDNPGTAAPTSFDEYREEWVAQGAPRFRPAADGDR